MSWSTGASNPITLDNTNADTPANTRNGAVTTAACGDGVSKAWYFFVNDTSGAGGEGWSTLDPKYFYLYDATANTWTAKTTYPNYHFGPPSFVYCSGKVYSIGGTDFVSFSTVPAYECAVYDPVANTWTAKAAIPAGASFVRAYCSVGTDIYMLDSAAALWKYSTTGNTWSQVSTLPSAITSDSNWAFNLSEKMITYSGKLYLFLKDGKVWEFNPTGSVWTEKQTASSVYSNYSGWDRFYAISGTAYAVQIGAPSSFYQSSSYSTYWAYDMANNLRADSTDFVITAATAMQAIWDAITAAGKIAAAVNIGAEIGTKVAFFHAILSADKTTVLGDTYIFDSTITTPTTVTPAAGATINTDIPVVAASAVQNGADKKTTQWQLATDAAFTQNVRLITDREQVNQFGTLYWADKYVSAGAVNEQVSDSEDTTFAEELYQGTWYIRARSGIRPRWSAWTAATTFTVTHPPAASPTAPIGDTTLDFGASGAVTLQWDFTDTSPRDVQTAYQIVVERNTDGTVLLDTGKVASQTTRQRAWNLPSANRDEIIRWKIRAWDSDDIAGAYSSYALFRMSDKPTVTITAPADGAALSVGDPTVTWTFAASAGRTQASYRVRFYAVPGGALVHDSGALAGSTGSYTPSSQVLDVGSYTVTVDSTDSRGLTGTDSNAFSTSYNAPNSPIFTVDSSAYADSGYIALHWNDSVRDDSFYSYRVYRRELGQSDADWKMIAEFTTPAGAYDYNDYSAGSGVTYEYVVVQAAYRFSSVIESSKVIPGTLTAVGTTDQYWLVHPTDSSLNVLLRSVKTESFKDEYESEVMQVIGRGRHTDRGTRWGYSGSLTASIRTLPDGTTAREQRLRLEMIAADGSEVAYRNPFGDVWTVQISDPEFGRVAGVGTSEFLDVSFTYQEVM